jgi:hypothetical protein
MLYEEVRAPREIHAGETFLVELCRLKLVFLLH